VTEIDEKQQKARIEKIIRQRRPDVELTWRSEGGTETHIVSIGGDRKRIRLEISQDALEFSDAPANIPRLERAILKELRVSESGKSVGYVTSECM
jgi:hypothetical protein